MSEWTMKEQIGDYRLWEFSDKSVMFPWAITSDLTNFSNHDKREFRTETMAKNHISIQT